MLISSQWCKKMDPSSCRVLQSIKVLVPEFDNTPNTLKETVLQLPVFQVLHNNRKIW